VFAFVLLLPALFDANELHALSFCPGLIKSISADRTPAHSIKATLRGQRHDGIQCLSFTIKSISAQLNCDGIKVLRGVERLPA
jgi:hypothetical protein